MLPLHRVFTLKVTQNNIATSNLCCEGCTVWESARILHRDEKKEHEECISGRKVITLYYE